MTSLPLFDSLDRMLQEAHTPHLDALRRGNYDVDEFLRGDALPTGIELKDEGLTKVQRKKAARDYRDRLIEALKLFPVRSRITIEQLRGAISDPPEGVHYNVMGSIVNCMAKRGLIEKTGRMVQAQRPGMHATELAEWEVRKYG